MKDKLLKINKELFELTELLERKKRLKGHLIELETTLELKSNQLLELEDEVNKESEDIEKLKKLTIKNLFIKILGNKEKQYEIESQEFLMAVLKHKGVVKEIEDLKYEYGIIKRKITEEFNLEKRHKILMDEKELILLELDNEISKDLSKLENKILSHKEMIYEIGEAIKKGKECEEILKNLEIGMRRAKKWGDWYYSGTKHVSEKIQKDYIKEATSDLYKANNLLLQFERELLDVFDHFKIDYRRIIEDLSDFLETFYDRLITDWLVLQKIDTSLNEIHNYHNKIVRIIKMLEEELKEVQEYLMEEEEERKEILLKYE